MIDGQNLSPRFKHFFRLSSIRYAFIYIQNINQSRLTKIKQGQLCSLTAQQQKHFKEKIYQVNMKIMFLINLCNLSVTCFKC